MSALRDAVKRVLARRGFEQVPRQDLEPEFLELYERCRPYTMTSIERMHALYGSVRHVIEREVPGDVVECGVFAGGSVMLAALTLQRFGDDTRRLWLYDTFTGMSEPAAQDGAEARAEWERNQRGEVNLWCYAARADVEENMALTGFPAERAVFVAGKVEETIPGERPRADRSPAPRHRLVRVDPPRAGPPLPAPRGGRGPDPRRLRPLRGGPARRGPLLRRGRRSSPPHAGRLHRPRRRQALTARSIGRANGARSRSCPGRSRSPPGTRRRGTPRSPPAAAGWPSHGAGRPAVSGPRAARRAG